jgi:ABC-type polar amino acid transport system ATPase subunit
MIELISVNKQFGDKPVLTDVSLSLQAGQVGMICGPSGSGKTTLLRTINRMEPIDSGDVRIDGRSLYEVGQDLCALRAGVGLVFQHYNLFSHLTALQNVVMPLVKVRRIPRRKARDEALALLRQFGLEHRAHAHPDDLSGGERQRVAIIRCLALQPTVMLFDEPTSALDWRLRAEVASNLRSLADRGIPLMVVTHDLDFACALGDRFFLLESGRLREVDQGTLACCDPALHGHLRQAKLSLPATAVAA